METELEPEFEKQGGIAKAKIGLVVCAILVGILAISNILVYVTLQNQITTLQTEKSDLQTQVDGLASDKNSLQNQINTLTSDKNYLQYQVDSLEESQLHMLNEGYIDLYLEPYVNCYGTIFNSGTKTAYNVVTTWKIYDVQDVLLATREIPIGQIQGKSFQAFDMNVECYGTPDLVTYEITWDYTI